VKTSLSLILLLIGTATFVFGTVSVPEIDGGSAVATIALISGGLLVVRARRKK